MKGGTVQINWHDTKPVLTLDFHPISGLLATGGADFDIKIWQIDSGEAQKKIPTASYQACLSYHSSAVNVLRFSPSGEMLASGADGGELILWKSHLTDAGQTWKVHKTLSFHRKDVLDMEWSGDGAFIISGSVDNSCIIWDAIKGCAHQILDSHLHYVQGVAWDPLSKYVASISSDRSCRIYVNKTQKVKGVEKMNYVCQHVILKTEQQTTDDTKSSKNHLFHDETLPSFFRRLAWSPDGSFLLVPAGSFKNSPASEFVNTAYVFSRKDLSRPALQLPGASKPVVAVRFCPLTFSLRGTNSSGFFKLPYRLIFAVVTLNSLYIYDTECVAPLAVLAGLHYAAITDVAWSPNGKYLALSSQDGYCTLVEFHDDELGSPVTLSGGKIINSGVSKDANEDKPVEMVVEASINDCPVVEKTLTNDKQTKPAASTPPVSTKLAKKHINPMEIINSDVNKDANEDKPVEMVVEASINDSLVVEQTQTNDKQTKPAASTPPVSTKPAKRRITPMAIDP